ncbi:MAG: NlpC/P60 family protein [Desulfobacterales bacterium]|jgi:cell wall-associated NlpC family hydrolase|nr:NlpC/P60 family protein [Desulfobacterales bacterium]
MPRARHSLRTGRIRLAAALCAGLLIAACAGQVKPPPEAPFAPARRPVLKTMRFTIQAGAFKNIDNAVRLTDRLLERKLSAYHFIDASGFYKVRIGNFPSREGAAAQAEQLMAAGVIEEFFIIAPEDTAAGRPEGVFEAQLRSELIRTAERFIGVPYRWGGDSTVAGFDCSGLTMVVYQLNGLELPRTSSEQWRAGRPVADGDLQAGDLVFFATRGGKRVSHVGIYTGGSGFLHAPGRGSRIEKADLASDYFRIRYLGARSYL